MKVLNVIYRTTDKELVLKKYLTMLPWSFASTICKFRTSNHLLPIEVGRHRNIPRVERLCALCDDALIGDEYHYIMECKHFSEERNFYLGDYLQKMYNPYKQLLLSQDKNVLIRLSKFLKVVFEHYH